MLSATLKGDARTSVSKRGRAGDDVDVRGAVSPTLRRTFTSTRARHRYQGNDSCCAEVSEGNEDDAEDAPDDDEQPVDHR